MARPGLPLAASNFNAGGSFAQLTTGFLVGHSRELLAVVQAAETRSKAKVIQAPSIIATDSIPASLNVGEDVPTLTSQGIAPGAQSAGNSLFTNTVGNRSTGVSLNITPYVNASGVVTMVINQNVSAPQPTTTSSISSPSFATKNVQTQVTVQDGDTIAHCRDHQRSRHQRLFRHSLSEPHPDSRLCLRQQERHPFAHGAYRVHYPRVIYDSNQLAEASDELKNKVRGLQKFMKE